MGVNTIVTLLIVVRVLVAVPLPPPEWLHLCMDIAMAVEEAELGLPLLASRCLSKLEGNVLRDYYYFKT